MKTNGTDMKVTALAPWFGGKRNLASRIVDLMRPHRSYWEPFCGSMAVLLAKPPAAMETVNDLNADLVNLARVVADPILGPKFHRHVRRLFMSEVLFREAQQRIINEETDSADPLPRAIDYFVTSWMGIGGVAGTKRTNYQFAYRYTHNGGSAATRYHSAVASVPAWRGRLRKVSILRVDALALLGNIADADETVIYVDPPYFDQARYMHNVDHEALAAALHRFGRAQVLLSYYDHSELDRLYPGWHRRSFDVSKALAHQAKRGGSQVRATEVILSNLPWESGTLF